MFIKYYKMDICLLLTHCNTHHKLSVHNQVKY